MPRRSGRYPWGSGENGYQHTGDFLSRVETLKKKGLSEKEIAESLGLTTTQLRTQKALAKNERRALDVARAKSLKEDGLGATEIAKIISEENGVAVNESTVRSWLNAKSETRMNKAKETAEFLKKQIDEKGMIDVGTGVEKELGISKEMLEVALRRLNNEGYPIYKGGVPQVTNPGQQTNQRVICPKGTEHKEIYNFDKIHPLNEDQYISRDGGKTFEKKFTYPASMDSKRLAIRYDEDGGTMKDGIIELRRGVDDLSLGNSRYAQVRILVDGTHYLKGMAVYSDNMPDGVDVVFNTNKKKGTPMTSVLKEIKDDPDNPFGSLIKDANQGGQYWYTDKKTGEKKLGLINKRADEGDWNDWADALPSQFLSKQALPMVKKQLDIAKSDKYAEFDEIKSLTNPTVKKHLLQKFADECDSAAVHLKAAALPGQKYHVIIPINSLKENEIYAPNYENGTKLALVRYPHGGTFEIPILTVNNKHAPARKLLGDDVVDAVGITSKVAERLSGADFDGDTVMCIPTHDKAGKVKISNRLPLADLDGFDPKLAYGYDKKTVDKDGTEHYYRNGREFKHMTKRGLQTQMGVISNLITDMTLDGGATDAELAAAVKHSMVIIDSYKHHLDYKESEIANNIAALHKKYQGKASGGAGTIVSRAKGQASVVKRQGTPKINEKGKEWYDPSKPEGSLIYKDADDAHYTYKKVNRKTGEVTTETGTRMQKTTKMANTDDAYTLVSAARNPKELAYADYANSMKALANQARLEMVHTGKIEYSSTAKNTYKKEVDSLMVKLNQAQLNTTRERAAQRMANAEIQAKQKANPNMDKSEIKKASQQALSKYRDALGSISRRDRNIDITDKEWEAIQAGAISENKLKQILDNTDVAKLRERATPRSTKSLSTSQINRIRAMSSTYTLEQIASKFNVSPSTISKYLKGGN